MIIHSIVPYEIIFGQQQEESKQTKYISVNNCLLEVTLMEGDTYKINRIISANLAAYLSPDMQPGSIIRYR